MIIEEIPCIENANRNYDYPILYWLDKNELNSRSDYYPVNYNGKYIAINGLYCVDETKNTFIGAIEAKSTLFRYLNLLDEKVYSSEKYFILCVQQEDSYYWCENALLNNIPKNALRATLNHNICEYLYIGKDSHENIGSIVRSDNIIYTIRNIKRIDEVNVSILCLKASPTSLKNLCKLKIQSKLTTNRQIERLSLTLPNNLVYFLRYPSFISSGECLLKGEKLISTNHEGVLEISHENKIIHMSYANNNKCTLKQQAKILYDFVDSIWIFKNFVAINRFNNAFVFFIYFNFNNITLKSTHEDKLKFLLNNESQLILSKNTHILKQFNI
jgi:hypothetical protein